PLIRFPSRCRFVSRPTRADGPRQTFAQQRQCGQAAGKLLMGQVRGARRMEAARVAPARWSVGVVRLVMDGVQPARVPDAVIAESRSREVRGLIELPQPPRVRPGDAVRILRGPFEGKLAIYAGMKPRARVEVLLSLLGSSQRVMLAADAVEAV